METEGYSLFLNSFAGSPYITNRISVADVVFTINWDAVFNMNNHKYNKCKIRYDFLSDNAPLGNPFTPSASNGVLVVNGINSRSTSTQGGTVLGLIDVKELNTTNNSYINQSIVANNFIGSMPVGVGTTPTVLTINSTSSPLFMLASGDTITYYNPTAFTTNGYTTPVGYVTKTFATVTGSYTYTLKNPDGSDFVNSTVNAVTNVPMTTSNPQAQSYTYLASTTLQSIQGQSIEVPRGMKTLEVLLCNNNYGQVTNGVLQNPLLQGTNLQDWGLLLSFEFSDPIVDQYTRN
jgi:hypothetical protein